MDNKFPRGINTGMDYGDSDWNNDYSYWIPDEIPLTKKCTCGTSITMGQDDHIDYHSDYCEMKENENSKTNKT